MKILERAIPKLVAMASFELFGGFSLKMSTSDTSWQLDFEAILGLNQYPFHKNIPHYPHKNNADNSIKIAFTNSELPKIIRTLFTSAH